MKADDLHQNLLNVIKASVPNKNNLATVLADILCLGKEAVYRRLRGDVQFTFFEIALITRKLNISLDNVVGTSIPESAIFHIDKNEYLEPSDKHYESFERCVEYYRRVSADPHSELGACGNLIPFIFTLKYPYLLRFQTFKWVQQQKNKEIIMPLNRIVLSDRIKELHQEHSTLLREIKISSYTWDNQIFAYVVNDLKQFNNVHLISDEEVALLKEELFAVVDEMEYIAAKGKFENGNKVQIFISSLNLPTNYTYTDSQNMYLTMIHMFILNSLASFDREIFDDVKNMIKTQQRFSTLISETCEMQRVQFFKKQRSLIATL